jgi:uncharacterized protein YfaS (alpha-2-macroglobulin family)
MTTEALPFKFVVQGEKSSIPIIVNPTVLNGFLFQESKTIILKQEDGLTLKNNLELDVPNNAIDNKVSVDVVYKPFNEKIFLTGLDKLVKEPYGCFEQTSSSTFPMVMLLQYLNEQDDETDQTAKMKLDIEKKLRKGVKRLLGFETSTGGFEWFGKSPGHATLTAYGIWQFVEMNKLGDFVEKEVLDRSLNWLKDQFDNDKKEFKFGNGLDSFARPPQTISDVYILFVMTLLDNYSVDFSSLLDPVLEKYKDDAFEKKDSYLLAFVGLAFENQNKKQEAREIVTKLLENQLDTGEFSSVETSITRSSGKNLKVEATAIALILLQKVDFIQYSSQIAKSIEFLQRNMQDGYFGSTQSTVLALKALADNSRNVNSAKRDQMSFQAEVGNQTKLLMVDSSLDDNSVHFNSAANETLNVDVSSIDDMQNGEKHVFSVNYSFRLPNLRDAESSPLSLTAKRFRNRNIESINVKVENNENKDQGMVIVVIHKPSYSKVNLNDLELLRTSGVIAFYELRHENSEMIFYWRGIKPNGSVGFELSLLDEFGHIEADPLAIGAYLYYDKDESFVHKMLN